MTDVSTNPIIISIGGQDIEFGRLRPNDLFKIIDAANHNMVTEGMSALGDVSLRDKVQAIRELSQTYDYSDIDDLLTVQRYALQLLYRSYLRANAKIDFDEFRELFENDQDILLACEQIDNLIWGQSEKPDEEAAKSTDPPPPTGTPAKTTD